ncbi:ROK family protein [Gordonia rhizosphera]|uniref:Putative sugar kinase n=1 Tax=Gordonia rhizosphera NBRC 16068 TaxID=1108045 RepID=K6W854_9ACTN|nr:ROK family protein [Gordonia rhizosphera]GAB89921.1 putative sugar kinase [Gordonia rhizosphera NBRC 16068]
MTAQGGSAARWLTAERLVDLVRTEPAITRAAAAQALGIGSGAATELLARLRAAELLDEVPAPAQGRGRPTTMLRPHPNGPLVVAAELSSTGWRVATADITGEPVVEASSSRLYRDPRRVLRNIGAAIGEVYARTPARIRAVSVSAAGTVSDGRLVQVTPRGWLHTDLSHLTSALPDDVDLPVFVGNDATLTGLAEARTGSARGVGTALHLIIAVGLGGALIVDGAPAAGAHGAAGEYGHIPFGRHDEPCACGASGCWDRDIDGRALARHRGDPEPKNPLTYAHDVLERVRSEAGRRSKAQGEASTRRAVEAVATSLGRGIAGLVNLHDPDAITIGGLAPLIRAAATAAFDDAYHGGLMSFRKQAPPPVLDGVHGDDGPLRGAALFGVDQIVSADRLAEWAMR